MKTCAFLDAVVARHLDGDVGGTAPAGGWQPDDVVTEHLRDCAVCQRHLKRSRRLDAMLAESSGRAASELAADPARLERLLARAVAAAAPGPAPGPRRWPLRTGVLLLALLLGLGAAWARSASRPEVPVAAVRVLGAALPAAHAEDRSPAECGIPLGAAPSFGARTAALALQPPRSSAEVDRLVALLTDRALGSRLELYAGLWLQAPGVRVPGVEARGTAAALRVRASACLLDATMPRAHDAWLAACAGLDGGPVLDAALADARSHPGTIARLRARLLLAPGDGRNDLGDLAVLTAAARLGGSELDAAVRAAVCRDASRSEVVAAALRTPCRRPGRAALLLDLFGDLVARGAADDERLACSLFAGQPAPVVAELLQELLRCRESPRRVRCLLALGALHDPAARPALLAALQGPVHGEAVAAAFALGQLPARALADLVPQARGGPKAWLLRAALFAAGLPAARAWFGPPDPTPGELRHVGPAAGTFARFPTFAELLRERTPAEN